MSLSLPPFTHLLEEQVVGARLVVAQQLKSPEVGELREHRLEMPEAAPGAVQIGGLVAAAPHAVNMVLHNILGCV